MDEDILRKLEERLGPLRARQRLGIETEHEAQIFGKGLLSFHIENWYPVHSVIRNALKLTGLYWRGRRNTGRILVKRNDVLFKELPPLFDGFTILHLSDMHVDMNEAAMQRLIELVGDMRYDLCVLTGDYRGKNCGPFEATLDGVARVRAHLKETVYGVLGDHDTIQMVPGLEAMGIRMLLNESEVIVRGDQQIYLAGIDDAHCFKDPGRQTEPIKADRNGVPSFVHSPHSSRERSDRCCANFLHGVAFLLWIRHPEPTGSRRATPLLLFQHSPGQFLTSAIWAVRRS
jgi:uncharacterized protein